MNYILEPDIRQFSYTKSLESANPTLSPTLPTDADYKNGIMYRYFCRQSNNLLALIVELDKAKFDALKSPLYSKTMIPWAITGTEKEVIRKNSIFIERAEGELAGITKHLSSNLLKFLKG